MRLSWSREEVDSRLHQIMINIHANCVKWGKGDDGYIDYVKGANIGGFVKVADAMIALGIVKLPINRTKLRRCLLSEAPSFLSSDG